MTSRPRLITNIPFWILFIASLGLTGLGTWIILDQLGRLEASLRDQSQTADQVQATVNVYVGQPAAVVGAVILGAGLVGLLLTLALAAYRTLKPEPATEPVETIDWTSDDQAVADTFAPATTAAPVAAPVITEDPDVEVPTTSPTPAAATHNDPVLDTEPAPAASASPSTEDDDKRV